MNRGTNNPTGKTSPKTSQVVVSDQERAETLLDNPPNGKTSGKSSAVSTGKTSGKTSTAKTSLEAFNAGGKTRAKVSEEVPASQSKELSITEQAQYVDESVEELLNLDNEMLALELLSVARELSAQSARLRDAVEQMLA